MYVQRVFFMLWQSWREIPVLGIRALVSAGLLIASSGCTDGVPKFGDLGNSIAAPNQFDQGSGLYLITSYGQTLTVRGACDKRSLGFELKSDSGSWISTAPQMNLSSELDCSDGQFALAIPDAGSFFGFTDGQAGEKDFSLRALSEVGASQPASLRVRYLTSVPEVILMGDQQGLEGSSLVFTASLSAPADFLTEIDFLTASGTAVANDFQLQTGTITFAIGESTKTITISSTADAVHESDETFTISLVNPVGATIGATSSAIGTIQNDDPLPEVGFLAATSIFGEGAGIVDLQVEVVGASDQAVTLTLAMNTGAGIADLGVDYSLAATEITLTPETTGIVNLPVTIAEDATFEGDEVINFELSAVGGGTINGSASQHQMTIQDNDSPPAVPVEFSVAPVSISESAGSVDLEVLVSSGPFADGTVLYSVGSGTAASGQDYNLASGSLVFLTGSTTSQWITVTILGDSVYEGTESLTLTLSSPTGGVSLGANASKTVTILDDESIPNVQFALTDSTVSEDNTSHSVAASISGASAQPISVSYSIGAGTLTNGGANKDIDLASSGWLVFPANSTANQNIAVTIYEDSVYEGAENLSLSLSSPVNANLGSNVTHVVSVTDDETVPTVFFSLSSSSVAEGDLVHPVNVSISGAAQQEVVVSWELNSSTATNASDFSLPTSGTVTFPSYSVAEKTVSVSILEDAALEGTEMIRLDLVSATVVGLGSPAMHTISILDDEIPSVEFAAPSATILESAASISLDVSIASASTNPITVYYSVSGGSATNGGSNKDYELSAGSVVFPALSAGAQSFNIPLYDDLWFEGSETIEVTLDSVVGDANLGAQKVFTLTLTDDETQPVVQFASSTSSVGEASTLHDVNVSLSGAAQAPVSVEFTVQSSTATEGAANDFELPLSGWIVFSPGAFGSQPVAITIHDDFVFEGDETVTFKLQNPLVASVGANDSHVMTIADNETQPTVRFTMGASSKVEDNTTQTINVSLSGASHQAISVDYSVTGGTATGSGVDYSLASGTLVFPAGLLGDQSLTVTLHEDTIFEGDETLDISLSNPVNTSVVAPSLHSFTITDDETAPTVQFSQGSSSWNEGDQVVSVDVSISGASAQDVSVFFNATGGDAQNGGAQKDYELASGWTVFPALTTGAQTIAVTLFEDSVYEGDESINLELSGPINGTLGSNTNHLMTIIDDDSLPTVKFAASGSLIGESGGSQSVVVSLTGSSDQEIEIDWSIDSGGGTTAVNGSDFNLATSGTITVPAYSTLSPSLSVAILDDGVAEGAEFIVLNLDQIRNAQMATPATHTVTIDDDEPTIDVEFAAGSQALGEGNLVQNIPVQISGAVAGDVTAFYVVGVASTASGSGIDYTLSDGSVTFPSGTTLAQNISLTLHEDDLYEGTETLVVSISSLTAPPGVFVGGQVTHTVTISDNETMPEVRFTSAGQSVPEGDAAISVYVTLSGKSASPVSVDYAVNGPGTTGISGVDYVGLSGTLVFPAQSLGPYSFDLTIKDDSGFDGSKNVEMILSSPNGAAIGTPANHLVTINDNDPKPEISFVLGSAWYSEPPTGNGTHDIDVTISAASSVDITVPIVLSGTAVPGATEDYTISPSSLVFPAGSLSTQSITLTLNADLNYESDETVETGLSANPALYDLGPTTLYIANVKDNTEPGSFSISGLSGGADSIVDGYLSDLTSPQVSWTTATGADFYRVTVFQSDNTTVLCGPYNTVGVPTNYSLGACSFVDGDYHVLVEAKKAGGLGLAALNANFPFTVDTTDPLVLTVNPMTGDFGIGDEVEVDITFDESVNVTGGSPRLPLKLNTGLTVWAGHVSGSGTATLKFKYMVSAGDWSDDPFYLGSAIDLNGAEIRDIAGVLYDPLLDDLSAFTLFSVNVDGVRPLVTSVTPPATGTYGVGDHLDFEVEFSEDVTVDVNSKISVLIGSQTKDAVLFSQAGNSAIYRYTVALGDEDTDGVGLGASLTSDPIIDVVGNEMMDFSLNLTGPFTGVVVETLLDWSASQIGLAKEGTSATLRVSLTATATQNITLTYSTSGGTATAGIDFVNVTSSQVVLDSGNITRDIFIGTTGDGLDESDETFTVTVTSPLLKVKPAFTITISDDDIGAPSLQYATTDCAALSGNLGFNRSSSATYFNNSGLMQTASWNQPRCETHPLTGEALGVLVEGERTNLLAFSQDFSNGAWNLNEVTVEGSLPDRLAPDGTNSVSRIKESNTTSTHSLKYPFAADPNSNYTFSVYMHGERRSWVKLSMKGPSGFIYYKWFNLNAVTGGDGPQSGGVFPRVEILGEWSRYSISANLGTGGAAPEVAMTLGLEDGPDVGSDPDEIYMGEMNSGIRIWGAQVEKGDFPSSYIATSGSTVTRAADQFFISNVSVFNLNSPGTVQVQVRQGSTSVSSYPRAVFALEDAALPGVPSGYKMGSVFSSGVRWAFGQDNNGIVDSRILTPVFAKTMGAAVSYNGPGGRTGSAIDGFSNSDITNSSSQPPVSDLNTLRLGSRKEADHLFGHIQSLSYFNQSHNQFELETATDVREIYFNYSQADIFRAEGGGNFVVTAHTTKPFASSTNVPFTIKGMVEDSGINSDFSSLSYNSVTDIGNFTFAPGAPTASITITVNDDDHEEETEDLFILIQAGTNYRIGTQFYRQFAITDDDDAPTIDLIPTNVNVSENGIEAVLSISLSGTTGREGLQVRYESTNGTADGSDFAFGSGSITIPQYTSGVLPSTISISIANDGSVFEGDEYFTVSLDVDGVVLQAGASIVSTVVIEDDDLPPTVGFQGASTQNLSEGTFVNLPVTLSSAAALDTTVNYSWSGAGGLDASDHNLVSGFIVIPAFQTAADISFNLSSDGPDPGEAMEVRLDSADVGGYSAAIDSGQDQIDILVIDGGGGGEVLSFVNTNVTGGEGNVIGLDVSLSATRASDTTFQLAWSDPVGVVNDPDPQVGDIYVDEAATFTIASGQSSLSVNVTLHSDGRDSEGDEVGTFSIVNPSAGISYSGLNLNLTINNRLPDIEVETLSRFPSVIEGEMSTIGVTLSRASDQPVSFSLVTDNANGATSSDYEILGSGSITIPPGKTKAYVPVPTYHDPIWANALLNPMLKLNAIVGATASLTSTNVSLTISDNSLGLEAQMVAAGSDFSCAVVNGGVLCWGGNIQGQLGRGTTDSNTNFNPEWVVGLGPGSGVTMVSAGNQYACAVVKGGAKCWGSNASGRLGDGTTTMRSSPVDVTGLFAGFGVTKIVAGNEHTCAIVRGEIFCWGDNNSNGALGDGTFVASSVPVATKGDFDDDGLVETTPISGATDIAIGGGGTSDHTCAVVLGGVMCWGSNGNGQLGRTGGGTRNFGRWVSSDRFGPPTYTAVPVHLGPGSAVTAISSGTSYSCAVSGSTIACWGYDTTGNLGDGGTVYASGGDQTYVSGFDPSGTRAVYSLSSSSGSTCAVSSAGTYCWGAGTSGQLGNNGSTNQSAPVAVFGYTSGSVGVKGVGVGQTHACSVVKGGIDCWGAFGGGRLGVNVGVNQTTPQATVRLGTRSFGVTQVSLAAENGCAIKHGDLYCWGDNPLGQLAQDPGIMPGAASPAFISQINGSFDYVSDVALGDSHACAVVSGTLRCWGSQDQGRLGNGNSSGFNWNPVTIGGLNSVKDVAAGVSHTCAVANNANTYCWGYGADVQLGQGGILQSNSPGVVSGLPTNLSQSVAVGPNNSCAVADGTAFCWGSNAAGQLGNGAFGGSSGSAVLVTDSGLGSLKAVSKMAVGSNHACAIAEGGLVYCWGANDQGQLGDGTTNDRNRAVRVRTSVGIDLSGATEIAAVGKTTCAIANSELICWGENRNEIFGSPAFFSFYADQKPFGWRAPSSGGAHGLSLGANNLCVAKMNQLHCWGRNVSGSMGIGETLDNVVIPYARRVPL